MIESPAPLQITIFTDPLCCWSWAFEPELAKIKETTGDQIEWSYRMGGLLPDWNNFHDQEQAVQRPAQMGPVWMMAGRAADMPIHHQLWINDPPASSYPACIAVKCAALQSSCLAEDMLYLLREASMGKGLNIAKSSVIFNEAKTLDATSPAFSYKVFTWDYLHNTGLNEFRKDLALTKQYQITRFPSFVIKYGNRKAILLSGYRKAAEVLSVLETYSRMEG